MSPLRCCLAIGPFLTGCKVVDAPETLEDLLVFGFTHHDDELRFSEAAAEALIPLTLDQEQALTEGYRVSPLSRDHIRAAGLEPPDEVSILGAATTVHMRSDVQALATVLTWPDMTEVQEPMLRWTVDSETDRDCFLARTCASYQVEGTRERDIGFLGSATQRFIRSWVWVELEGASVLIQRELMPDPAEITTAVYQVDQQYAYSVLFPHQGGTQRLEAYWVDAQAIGMDLPDTLALDLAVQAVQSNAEELDAFAEQNL